MIGDRNLKITGYAIKKLAKLTIIEKAKTIPQKHKVYILLDHKGDFWALRLQTVAPKDLTASLNYIQDIT